MRIKFLSVIVSFFFVSFAITSCLDSDDNIEYSPDATIHAFALDTIYGVNYRFTINQFGPDGIGEIYNQDSLPVGSDTIINKILIKTLTTASGLGTSKNSLGQDTIMNLSDSIDLRTPITIKVWSTEALSGKLEGLTKEYKITVNVHKQDPDSMQWMKMKELPDAITGTAKAVLLGKDILVYGKNKAYRGRINEQSFEISSWDELSITVPQLINSVVNFNGTLYATTTGGKLYQSTEGTSWNEITALSGRVKTLLAAFTDSISAIRTGADGENYFCKSNGTTAWVESDTVPKTFRMDNISASVYKSSTGIETGILVGDDTSEGAAPKYTVPWFTTIDNRGWTELNTTAGSTTSYPSCPYLKNPSIIYYNDAFYTFGGDFNGFNKSLNGIAWYAADKKFWMPEEFKNKGDYSMVLDKNNFIWIIWNTGEVWRGRLNKLGFKNKQ